MGVYRSADEAAAELASMALTPPLASAANPLGLAVAADHQAATVTAAVSPSATASAASRHAEASHSSQSGSGWNTLVEKGFANTETWAALPTRPKSKSSKAATSSSSANEQDNNSQTVAESDVSRESSSTGPASEVFESASTWSSFRKHGVAATENQHKSNRNPKPFDHAADSVEDHDDTPSFVPAKGLF
jgi:hypothetical protein